MLNWPLSIKQVAVSAALCMGLMVGFAHALDAPRGPVVLSISGKVAATNMDGKALFDMPMLRALPQHTFTTETAWDKRPVKFAGPRLRDVLRLVKGSGTEIRAIAINDYAVSVPVSDADKFELIVATTMNDRDIPARTKGPLFLVYPFSSDPVLKDKVYQDRSIWQLKGIEIK
jgi:hypothetical protein